MLTPVLVNQNYNLSREWDESYTPPVNESVILIFPNFTEIMNPRFDAVCAKIKEYLNEQEEANDLPVRTTAVEWVPEDHEFLIHYTEDGEGMDDPITARIELWDVNNELIPD